MKHWWRIAFGAQIGSPMYTQAETIEGANEMFELMMSKWEPWERNTTRTQGPHDTSEEAEEAAEKYLKSRGDKPAPDRRWQR